MRSYTHLTQEQRYQIHLGLQVGCTLQEIADAVGVNKSTVSREVRRNSGVPASKSRRSTIAAHAESYEPETAHEQARRRRQAQSRRRLTRDDWQMIEQLLARKWSPEQISLWLRKERLLAVSHEWIYRHIAWDRYHGGELYQHLRCRKQRRKRYASGAQWDRIPNRVSIEQRPAVVDERGRTGDWEIDTVYGKNNTAVMVTMVERVSRYVVVDIVPNRTASVVGASLIQNLAPFKDQTLTLTADNGGEFAQHEAVAKALDADFYFSHPYASWERGTNENTNGLLRQYFPKNRDLATVTPSELSRAVNQLNNRPRKCLDMKTPNEVLFGIEPYVALGT